ncbi:transposase, partial [Streptomyces sp. ISL-98]|nr:transposase [Streptomyces sp. ISL-98]
MTTEAMTEDAGHARWTFRLRVSSTTLAALMAEWDRCRWIWNESCAKSKQTHLWNKHRFEGIEKRTCGPAQLDKMLTEARSSMGWLREGSSVPQQQCIRDFGKSRAKAQKDVKDRLPMARRAGMPKYKRKREARPSLNYTKRGFRLR